MKFIKENIEKNLKTNISNKKLINILNKIGFEINSIEKKKFFFKIIKGEIKNIINKDNKFIYIIKTEKKIIKIKNLLNNNYLINEKIFIIKNKNDKKEINIIKHNDPILNLENIYKLKNNNVTVYDVYIPFNRTDCLNEMGISNEISLHINNESFFNNISKKTNYFRKKNYLIKNINSKICKNYYYFIINNINIKNSFNINNIIKNYIFLHEEKIDEKNYLSNIIKYIYLKTGFCIHILNFYNVINGITIDYYKDFKKKKNKNKLQKYVPVINSNNNLICIPNIIDSNKIIYTNKIFVGCGIFNYKTIPIKYCNDLIKYNLHKYSQSINPYILEYTIKYTKNILLNILGGYSDNIFKFYKNIKFKCIKINFSNIRRSLGIRIKNKTIINILNKIGFIIKNIKKNKYELYFKYKDNITNEQDIFNEILKFYNINNIILKKINENNNNNNKYNIDKYSDIKNYIVYNGYQEIITNSIINTKFQSKFFSKKNFVNIINPMLKDESVMRISLILGIINNIIFNKNRKEENIKIFEIGNCFKNKNNKIETNNYLSCSMLTKIDNIKNININENYFYKFKNILENILLLILKYTNNYLFLYKKISFLEENTSLIIKYNNLNIGFIGIINNSIINEFNNKLIILIFEINLSLIKNINKNKVILSEFTNLLHDIRDISINIKIDINSEILIKDILSTNKNIYKAIIKNFYINNIKKYKNLVIRLFIIKKENKFYKEINYIVEECINYLNKKYKLK